MTTGKTIALTRQTFVSKVMSLLFNMLSRLVITFLTRSKCLRYLCKDILVFIINFGKSCVDLVGMLSIQHLRRNP